MISHVCELNSTPQESEGRELPAQCGLGIQAEPSVEQGGVDLTEVDAALEVALLQVGQTGIRAHHTGLDARSRQQDRPGGAVVGAGRALFGDTPAELAEAYDYH